VEGLVSSAGATTSWQGRRVLVTGHTGFKGGWLTLWLHQLGADASAPSPHKPGKFPYRHESNAHIVQHKALPHSDMLASTTAR
jgi:nucleoside-diphosphate-sugar epimerase